MAMEEGGEGRGRAKAPQETHQDSCHHSNDTITWKRPIDKGIPSPPALSSGYPTRCTKRQKVPRHSSSLKLTMRTLNEPLPRDRELQHCASQPTGEDLVCENTVKDVEQVQGPREAQPVGPHPSLHEDALRNHQPSGNINMVTRVNDEPEKNTANYINGNSPCLSASDSVNITELAQRLLDDMEDHDPEEVQSAFHPAFDCINGHRVKIEFAPVVRAIFAKYGDITRGSDVDSSNVLSLFLERICGIYRRLEQTKFSEITCTELEEMLLEVRYYEREKLNVRWILEKLEYISQANTSLYGYLSVKKEEAKYNTSIRIIESELKAYKRGLFLIQQKISAAEEELVVKKAKAEQNKKVALDIKARVSTLEKQSLVHGLL